MGWLGLDDTDSLSGGCTTAVMDDLLANLPSGVIQGTPCLVRLWPMAQQRTRGNAALAVELTTDDEPSLLSHLDHWWNDHLEPLAGHVSPSQHSARIQVASSPGMVWFSTKPDPEFYWRAVRGEVVLDDAPSATRRWGGMGVIGATAAVAWDGPATTWEAIAWRMGDETGSKRRIDEDALHEIDAWPEVVLSRDPRQGKQLIAPRGNSPVLFGVRSLSQTRAEEACLHLAESKNTEPVRRWRVFQTNQASGDHLATTHTFVVESVDVHPARKHATVSTDSLVVRCFAEGGPVNALARWLKPGDRFEVRGLVASDGSLHAEQMRVVAPMSRRRERPLCSDCLVRLKSMGTGQGLRCPQCKQRSEDEWKDLPPVPPFDGWVEPPMDGRRHLARPLGWSEPCSSRGKGGNP